KLRNGAPEAFKVVKAAGLVRKDVDNKTAEIEQSPVGRALAFAMFRFALQFLVKNFFHFRADGLQLRRAEAGTDDEKISERAEARKIQNGNGGGFLVLRRLNCEAHGFGKGVDFHLDSFTSRTLPVEALLKNVFLDARGYKPMNGLAAVGAFARFRGG